MSFRIPLLKAVRNHVIQYGPMAPLKLLRHSLQVYYSKTKGGCASRLNSGKQLTILEGAESGKNILIQILKFLIIDGFTAWLLM